VEAEEVDSEVEEVVADMAVVEEVAAMEDLVVDMAAVEVVEDMEVVMEAMEVVDMVAADNKVDGKCHTHGYWQLVGLLVNALTSM